LVPLDGRQERIQPLVHRDLRAEQSIQASSDQEKLPFLPRRREQKQAAGFPASTHLLAVLLELLRKALKGGSLRV
jgi:hypothetical protein